MAAIKFNHPPLPLQKNIESPKVKREHLKIARNILSLHTSSHKGFEIVPKALSMLQKIEIPTLKRVEAVLKNPNIRDQHLDITSSQDQLTLAVILAIGQPIAIPFGSKEGMLAIFAHPSNEGIRTLNQMKGRPIELIASVSADVQHPGTVDKLFDIDSLDENNRIRLHRLLDELFSMGPIGIYGNANSKSKVPPLMYSEINGQKKVQLITPPSIAGSEYTKIIMGLSCRLSGTFYLAVTSANPSRWLVDVNKPIAPHQSPVEFIKHFRQYNLTNPIVGHVPGFSDFQPVASATVITIDTINDKNSIGMRREGWLKEDNFISIIKKHQFKYDPTRLEQKAPTRIHSKP